MAHFVTMQGVNTQLFVKKSYKFYTRQLKQSRNPLACQSKLPLSGYKGRFKVSSVLADNELKESLEGRNKSRTEDFITAIENNDAFIEELKGKLASKNEKIQRAQVRLYKTTTPEYLNCFLKINLNYSITSGTNRSALCGNL